MSINDLAKKLFVSPATVSRTAKKLGLSGYKELKYTIISDSHNEIKHRNNKESIILSIEQTFFDTINQYSSERFEYIRESINEAKNIEIFSVGGSYAFEYEFARKLKNLNYNANARSDWDELDLMARRLGKNDLAIFFSQTGETQMLINFAKQLKSSDVVIILFVGDRKSTLSGYSDECVYCPTLYHYYNQADVSLRFSFSVLSDLLILKIIEK